MIQKEQNTIQDSLNAGSPSASLIEDVEGGDQDILEETQSKGQESLNAGPPPATLIDDMEGGDLDKSDETMANMDSV